MQIRPFLGHFPGKGQVILNGPHRSLRHSDRRGLHAARIRKLRRAVECGDHVAFREELGLQRAGQELDARVTAVHVVLLVSDHAIKRIRDGDAGIQHGSPLCCRLDRYAAVRSDDAFGIDQTVDDEGVSVPAFDGRRRIAEPAGDRVGSVRLGVHKVQLRVLLDRNRVGDAVRPDCAVAGSNGGIHDQQGFITEVRAVTNGHTADSAALVHSGIHDDLAARAERHSLAERQHGFAGSHGEAVAEGGRIQPRFGGLGLEIRDGTDFHHGAVAHQQAGTKGIAGQAVHLHIGRVDEQRAARGVQGSDVGRSVQHVDRALLQRRRRRRDGGVAQVHLGIAVGRLDLIITIARGVEAVARDVQLALNLDRPEGRHLLACVSGHAKLQCRTVTDDDMRLHGIVIAVDEHAAVLGFAADQGDLRIIDQIQDDTSGGISGSDLQPLGVENTLSDLKIADCLQRLILIIAVHDADELIRNGSNRHIRIIGAFAGFCHNGSDPGKRNLIGGRISRAADDHRFAFLNLQGAVEERQQDFFSILFKQGSLCRLVLIDRIRLAVKTQIEGARRAYKSRVDSGHGTKRIRDEVTRVRRYGTSVDNQAAAAAKSHGSAFRHHSRTGNGHRTAFQFKASGIQGSAAIHRQRAFFLGIPAVQAGYTAFYRNGADVVNIVAFRSVVAFERIGSSEMQRTGVVDGSTLVRCVVFKKAVRDGHDATGVLGFILCRPRRSHWRYCP